MYPQLPHTHSLPNRRHPRPEWCLCYNWWTYTDTIIITPSPWFTLLRTPGAARYMCLDKRTVTGSPPQGVIWSVFAALQFLCSAQSCLLPTTVPGDHWSFPLPRMPCRRVGIREYVAFPDWLLWLSNIHLRSLRIFSWLESSFLFSTERFCVWMYEFMYPVTYSRTSW